MLSNLTSNETKGRERRDSSVKTEFERGVAVKQGIWKDITGSSARMTMHAALLVPSEDAFLSVVIMGTYSYQKLFLAIPVKCFNLHKVTMLVNDGVTTGSKLSIAECCTRPE